MTVCRCAAWAGLALLVVSPGAATAEREPLGRGASFHRREPACTCQGVARKGIFAHPPWQDGVRGRVAGEFEVDLTGARDPVLCFHMGIQDGHGSDQGLIYRVFVDGKELFREFWKDSVWSPPVQLDLKPYAGRHAKIELAVDTLGEHYANWGEPRIMDGDRVLADLADLAGQARTSITLTDKLAPEDLPERLRQQAQATAQEAVKAVPTPRQLAWQEMEFIAFVHFGMNTLTNREWGEGKEDPKLFDPKEFDAKQWVRVCRDAGLRLLILTAKHHDGFCLWPSRYTEHSVRNSPWRGGRGDVVREVAEACREAGLAFGVYLSPWDRNHPAYGDSPVYNEYFRNQLRELLTDYGEIREVWFDGACGEGPNGKKQVYDWPSYYQVVRECQPQAVIAVSGPDVRWVGNEDGMARETEWSVQPANAAMHGRTGFVWWPAECDVSIRPGWFYHADQDDNVKSLAQLLDIYYRSVGRNAVLLLNLPPAPSGLIHDHDHRRLCELRKVLDDTFRTDLAQGGTARASSAEAGHPAAAAVDADPATYWTPAAGPAELEVDVAGEAVFNRVMLQEFVANGQRVEAFTVEAWDGAAWKPVATGTTIGYKRLLVVPDTRTAKVRLVIGTTRAAPQLRRFGLFRAPATPEP